MGTASSGTAFRLCSRDLIPRHQRKASSFPCSFAPPPHFSCRGIRLGGPARAANFPRVAQLPRLRRSEPPLHLNSLNPLRGNPFPCNKPKIENAYSARQPIPDSFSSKPLKTNAPPNFIPTTFGEVQSRGCIIAVHSRPLSPLQPDNQIQTESHPTP